MKSSIYTEEYIANLKRLYIDIKSMYPEDVEWAQGYNAGLGEAVKKAMEVGEITSLLRNYMINHEQRLREAEVMLRHEYIDAKMFAKGLKGKKMVAQTGNREAEAWASGYNAALDMIINKLLAAKGKHALWDVLSSAYDLELQCTGCGRVSKDKGRFCPWCGAVMDGETEYEEDDY